jgi:hypothetical protein
MQIDNRQQKELRRRKNDLTGCGRINDINRSNTELSLILKALWEISNFDYKR